MRDSAPHERSQEQGDGRLPHERLYIAGAIAILVLLSGVVFVAIWWVLPAAFDVLREKIQQGERREQIVALFAIAVVFSVGFSAVWTAVETWWRGRS